MHEIQRKNNYCDWMAKLMIIEKKKYSFLYHEATTLPDYDMIQIP
jgi:hypothetical protein